jgi:hypothetical protein
MLMKIKNGGKCAEKSKSDYCRRYIVVYAQS